MNKTFNIIYNPVYPDSITYNSYFNRLIAFNTIVDSIIANINFNIIPSQVYSCDSYFEPIILNTKTGNEVFPEYIIYDSNNNKLLTLNEIFPNYIIYDSDSNKLLTLNLVTSTIINNIFNIQNPIFSNYSYFNKLITQEFQKWKEN